jgi:hypothetical protein
MYDHVPDVELAARLHQKSYADKLSFSVFAEKFGVQVGPVERGFLEKMSEAYRRGRSSTLADVAIYDAVAKGIGDEDDAMRIWRESRTKEQMDPIDSSFIGDMVLGSSRLIGQWGQSLKAGGAPAVVLGGLGAAGGAAVGAIIPTVGEEPLTVAGGAMVGLKGGVKLGLAEGAGLFMYKQGTGQMYATMRDQGIDKDTAMKVAQIAAIPYALVEAVQFKQAASLGSATVREMLQNTGNKLTLSIAKRIGTEYAKTLAGEVGEEMIQEVIQIAAEDTAAQMSDFGVEYDAKYLEQRIHRVLITAAEAGKSMALLPLPGAAWNMAVERAVHQNLIEEDPETSMVHEGHKPRMTQEQFLSLPKQIRDAATKISDDTNMNLDDAVEIVEKLQTPQLDLVGLDEKILQDNVDDAVAVVNAPDTESGIVGVKEGSRLKRSFKKGMEFFSQYGLQHIRTRNILRRLDGEEHGVLNNLIIKVLRTGTGRGAVARAMAIQELRNAITDRNIDMDDLFKKSVEVKSTEQMIAPVEALEVYLAQFDQGKKRHLMVGNKMSEAQIKEVVNSMDERYVDLGNWLLEQYRSGWGDIAQVYAAVNDGAELPQIDGYSQIFTDEKGPRKTVDYADLLLKEMDRRGFKKRGIKKEMVKKRTESVAPLRLDAITNFFEHKMQTEWYKNVAIPAYKVGKILNNPEFQKGVNAKTNDIGSSMLSKWLQDVASERTTLETTWYGRVMNVLRQNAVVAALGFNILSTMRQPLSVLIAMAEDPRMIPRIMGNFAMDMRDPVGFKKFVESKSRLVKTRAMDREIRNMGKSKDARVVLGRKVQLSDIALAGIKFMDQNTVNVVWKSAYELAIDKGMSESMSIDYADGVIEKTQPMADIMDLPAFFRGSTLEKMFSTFQNQINQNLNYWRDDIIGARGRGEIGSAMVAYRVLFSLLLPAMLMGMVSRGRPQEEAEEPIRDIAAYTVAPAFWVGSVASGLIQGYGVRLPIGMGMIEDIAKGAANPEQLPKRLSGAVAQAYGLPWSQPRRTLEGIIALGEGETQDKRRLIWNKYALEKEAEKGPTGKLSRRRRRRRGRR